MMIQYNSVLTGEEITTELNAEVFAAKLALYREMHPLDNRPFGQLSSDVQHAIIRATRNDS